MTLRRRQRKCPHKHPVLYHELCPRLLTSVPFFPLAIVSFRLFINVVSRMVCFHGGKDCLRNNLLCEICGLVNLWPKELKVSKPPWWFFLASDTTGYMYGNLLVDVFISVDCLVKIAGVLSMKDFFFLIVLFLLEFSNAQSRIRKLTRFNTEESSMYLNLTGGKAFNFYSDSYDWTCWILEK